MADNIVCKHCGHIETLHLRPQDIDEPRVLIDGYPVSLEDCSGYEPSNPELAKKLAARAAEEDHLQTLAKFGNRPGS